MVRTGSDTPSNSIRNCKNQHMIDVETIRDLSQGDNRLRHDPWIGSQKCRSVELGKVKSRLFWFWRSDFSIELRSSAPSLCEPASGIDSLGYFNASPEGNMMLHVTGSRLRIRVVPRRVRIFLSIHDDRVIPRLALPWTTGGR